MAEQRAPKQMRHWAAQHGLYPRRWRKSSWRDYPIFRTHKARFTANCTEPVRWIRVLPHLDRMDICDGYFDRWANSTAASIEPIPRTRAEFDAALSKLLAKAAPKTHVTMIANT